MKRIYHKVGDKIGNITLLEGLPCDGNKNKKWICQCACGKVETKCSTTIRSAKIANTGCNACALKSRSIKRTTHGDTNSPLHKLWMRMRSRCHTPSSTQYPWYGGKGINITKDWNEFISFKKWALSNGYSNGLTIDRINPDKNYSPNNCRFLTKSENSRYARTYRKEKANV